VLVLVLTGCSGTASDAPTPTSEGGSASEPLPTPGAGEVLSTEQEVAISDGISDTAEYQEGFRRYQACLSAAGYELLDVTQDEYGFISAGIPDAAVQAGVDSDCYVLEWKYLDMYWQLANAINSPTYRLLAACLEENGIEPGETTSEIDGQLEEAGISISQC
jgi:hypothetical protein